MESRLSSQWLSSGMRAIGAAGLAILIAPTGVVNAETTGALGNLSFQTTCDSEANSEFEEGLGLLHHMMYQRAQQNSAVVKRGGPIAGCFIGA